MTFEERQRSSAVTTKRSRAKPLGEQLAAVTEEAAVLRTPPTGQPSMAARAGACTDVVQLGGVQRAGDNARAAAACEVCFLTGVGVYREFIGVFLKSIAWALVPWADPSSRITKCLTFDACPRPTKVQ
jgi:hypothetical protein